VFHPENIEIGDRVYVGHLAILKAHHMNKMVIGDGSWVGEQCYFHSAGGITIGREVGVGPGVKVLTSYHRDGGIERALIANRIEFAPVVIGDGSDIGIGSIVLPGVRIGRGVQVGAGAVVARNLPDYVVAAGVPARVLRKRRRA
jgi:acetyltransferase-like isoleucine patch superfamily enzyme